MNIPTTGPALNRMMTQHGIPPATAITKKRGTSQFTIEYTKFNLAGHADAQHQTPAAEDIAEKLKRAFNGVQIIDTQNYKAHWIADAPRFGTLVQVGWGNNDAVAGQSVNVYQTDPIAPPITPRAKEVMVKPSFPIMTAPCRAIIPFVPQK